MKDLVDLAWTLRFAELQDLAQEDLSALARHAQTVQLPAGYAVFAPGKKPESFLLLLEGTVRVQQTAASGREIILYRVSGGESCIMTTACLLSDESYLAEGITETPVTAVAIPKSEFDRLMADSSAFRRLVFSRYASRMVALQRLVEDVAFERMDKRLAHKLLELADSKGNLEMTHQGARHRAGHCPRGRLPDPQATRGPETRRDRSRRDADRRPQGSPGPGSQRLGLSSPRLRPR